LRALLAVFALVVGVEHVGVRLALVVLALLAALVELVGEVEGGEKIAGEAAEGLLVEHQVRHAVER
jgi:hypothetical protein